MALDFETKLIENISEFRRLESEALAPDFDKAGLLRYLRDKAGINVNIMIENNNIIEQKLRPMLESLCNAKDADDLFALSQKLYTYQTNLDNGLALEIHKGIIAWARANKDVDRLIRSLYSAGFIYWQILALMMARKNHAFFYDEALEMFEEGASYVEHYFEIDNKETRMYINRCLGNVYVVLNSKRHFNAEESMGMFFGAVDNAIAFWNNEKVRAFDPDFPWTSFIGNAHQNALAWEHVLRGQPLHTQNPELVARVCESFSFLEENRESVSISQYWTKTRTENSRRFNSYFRKIISQEELIEQLREVVGATKGQSYSAEDLFEMFNVPLQLIEQLEMLPSADKESTENEIRGILANMVSYVRNVPGGVSKYDFAFSWAVVH